MSEIWYNMDRSLVYLLENVKIKNVVIVGAGVRGITLKNKLEKYKIIPRCFFDNNINCQRNETETVIRIQKPCNFDDDSSYVIAVDNPIAREELRKQLIGLGIAEKCIWNYYGCNYDFWKNLDASYYQREISAIYKETFNREMNWDNPKTYNEKLNWEKLRLDDQRRTILADKFLVREWVAEKIGNGYLNTLYGVWENADEINFEKLPGSFVLKCNHGSGWNIIVKDKNTLDIEKTRKQLNEWLELNPFYAGFEKQYKDIPPKIICEAYLEGMAETVYDYNIYCFHGKPRYIWCINGSHKPGCKASFYDLDWNMLDFHYGYPLDPVEAPKPKQLKKMLELSTILSRDFDHVRVDWYNMPDGKVLFGEMTFTTWNGLRRFEPEEWDLKLGEMI